MTAEQADFILLRKEIDAFIHIMEVLAQCKQHSSIKIDHDAVQRMARVLNLHISKAVDNLSGA